MLESAQNDSIYSLQASVNNGVLTASFLSTYNKEKLQQLNVVAYTSDSTYLGGYNAYWRGTELFSKRGTYTVVAQSNEVSQFTVSVELYDDAKNRNLKISFSLIGTDYKSNSLPFVFTSN